MLLVNSQWSYVDIKRREVTSYASKYSVLLIIHIFINDLGTEEFRFMSATLSIFVIHYTNEMIASLMK